MLALHPFLRSLLLAAPIAAVQQPQPQDRPAYVRPASVANQPVPEIHVDQRCRILPDPAIPAPGKKKPRPHFDLDVCHLEKVNTSARTEESPMMWIGSG
jgi:hypothetical protein